MPLARTGSLRFLGGQACGPQPSNRASLGTHIWGRRSASRYLEKRFQTGRSSSGLLHHPHPTKSDADQTITSRS